MRVCASPPLGPRGRVCRGHRPWLPGSPIIAGVCKNCCRITCHRLAGCHPSNVGVPRMRSNVSWNGGAGTTVRCGATHVQSCRSNLRLEYECIDQSGLGIRIAATGRLIEADHIPRQMVRLELETNEMFITRV